MKGVVAGREALCYEWLAGRIAQAFELPIPPFVQATVPPDLVKYSALPGIEDLGAGLAFASENAEGAEEFALANMRHVPVELRRRVLVFDWMVQNQDRTLGDKGGNVNILFLSRDSTIRIIDHNIAFDTHFDLARFRRDHVFRSDLDGWSPDLTLAMERRVQDIASHLVDYFAELPDEWTETAALLETFSLDRIKAVVGRAGLDRDLHHGVTQ